MGEPVAARAGVEDARIDRDLVDEGCKRRMPIEHMPAEIAMPVPGVREDDGSCPGAPVAERPDGRRKRTSVRGKATLGATGLAIVYGRAMPAEALTISLPDGETVSGLWQAPAGAKACLALAHGAGAGMTHRAMSAIADGLEALGVATLRYQFPYMEKGGKRVDAPPMAHAAARAAAAEARRRGGGLPLFAGGRSFGGRMTSQAQAREPMAGVRGLVFFAFPLHPAGKPAVDRAEHLQGVALPMLFLQGTNDALAELGLLQEVVTRLGDRASLALADRADHSFHVPARTGRKDEQVLADLLRVAAEWMVTTAAEDR